MKKRFVLWFFPCLLVDIFIKYYIYHFIPKMSYSIPSYPYGGIGVFKHLLHGIDFSIVHVENLGAAWGIFAAYSEYLLWARIVIIGILLFYVFFMVKSKKKQIPIYLIIAGACGNILDFLFYGHVIDMFYFKFWNFSYPIFNFADCLITIGIVFLFLTGAKRRKIISTNVT